MLTSHSTQNSGIPMCVVGGRGTVLGGHSAFQVILGPWEIYIYFFLSFIIFCVCVVNEGSNFLSSSVVGSLFLGSIILT